MDAAAILRLFRAEAKDAKLPYLWQDPELLSYLAQGEAEVARRTRCLGDNTTAKVAVLPVVAGGALFKLDSRVLFLRRAKLASQPLPLPKCDRRDLDFHTPGWEQMPPSAPCTYFPLAYRQIQLVPAPDAVDTLTLDVIRLPLNPIESLTDEPEIEERTHHGLVHWVLHRAYGKQDSQTNDPNKSANALALFEREFGPASTYRDELWLEQFHGMDQFEGIY